MRREAVRTAAACCLFVVCASCGGPTEPSGVVVSSVAPTTGSTLGGTTITIAGANFAEGATVVVGGAPATAIGVESSTRITAITPQAAAGTVDVVVSSRGRTATLPRSFTYTAPILPANTPPTIVSIRAAGARRNEPAQFADLDEKILVSAVVQDAETPISQLAFEWESDAGGSFIGTGPGVSWQAPGGGATPRSATLTLTVVEKYQGVDASGLPPLTKENRARATTVVSVHDSTSEIGQLARQFLFDFSDSNLRDVAYIVRNFTDLCPQGKASETNDVAFNRQHFRINSSFVGPAAVSIDFAGTCPFRLRSADGCAQVPVDWSSTFLDDNSPTHVVGVDQVTAVYDIGQQRWGLCDSDFDGRQLSASGARGFIR